MIFVVGPQIYILCVKLKSLAYFVKKILASDRQTVTFATTIGFRLDPSGTKP